MAGVIAKGRGYSRGDWSQPDNVWPAWYPFGMKRIAILALVFALASCGRGEVRQGASDITGVMPSLSFSMTRANDRAPVNAESYRGKVVALYFGYTHCPDECPTTLANLA